MKPLNAIPEICELSIKIVPSESSNNKMRCTTELRLFRGDIPLGDDECEISIIKATILLELEGLSPAERSRYGEPRKSNSTQEARSIVKQSSRAIDCTASANAGATEKSIGFSISGEGKRQSARSEEVTSATSDKVEHLRVRAIPNLRWQISEPDGAALDGTYLDGDDLVGLERTENSNRSLARASISVKQRDLIIAPVQTNAKGQTRYEKLTTNQKRLLDIFIAKSLSNNLSWNTQYRGEIKISEDVSEVGTND